MAETIRILVGDKLAQEGIDYLNSFEDVEVDVKTGLSEDELAKIIGQYHGLIIRSGVQVTAKVLENPGKLKGIARAGVGVDNIDLDASTAKGILVMNSAEASTVTTAELAFTLLMAMARNIGPAATIMTQGGWDRGKFVGTQLSGKTLGIVGFGRIGQTVAKRAIAFGMKVLAFDPVYNAETALDGRVRLFKSFDEILPQVDFISFHVPLNDQTRNMLNADRFAMCRDGVMIVNAARGGVIDIDAMLEAIESGKCGGAAIDVYEKEPLASDSTMRNNPKVLLTPHLGASTAEAQLAVSTDACAQLLEYLKGEGLRGAVNLGGVRFDLEPSQTRFIDLAQRMAKLLAPMCEDGISSFTTTINGNQLGNAVSTAERMALIEMLQSQLELPVNLVNVKLIADQRGISIKTVTEEAKHDTTHIRIDVQSGECNRYITGTIYADHQPRVLEINGYHMDMIPAGPMLIVLNEDKPGMIGLVGSELSDAMINIADMAISRKGDTAMMVIKIDQQPDEKIINRLRNRPGILKVAEVNLPPLNGE